MKQIIFIHDGILYRDALCHFITSSHHNYKMVGAINANGIDDNCDLIVMEFNDDFFEGFFNHVHKDMIVLTNHVNNAKFKNKSNIKGILQKDCSAILLQDCIQKVFLGEFFYQKESIKIKEKTNNVGALTKREREVLGYLAQGDSNKEIANALSLEIVTIKLHVRSICKKLNVSNRTKAALLFKESTWN